MVHHPGPACGERRGFCGWSRHSRHSKHSSHLSRATIMVEAAEGIVSQRLYVTWRHGMDLAGAPELGLTTAYVGGDSVASIVRSTSRAASSIRLEAPRGGLTVLRQDGAA